jgi:hypothetical protein
MTRARISRIALVVIVLALAGFVAWRWLDGDAGNPDTGEGVAVRLRARLLGDEVHVAITAQELEAAGIGLQPLQASKYQDHVTGFGSVVSPQTLVEAQRAYQAAQAEVDRTEVAVKAARLEVQRLQPLHRDDRIVSDKALETARVAVVAEETNLQLARGRLDVQAAVNRQQWGPVLGGWLKDGAQILDRLLTGQDVLLKIALPAGRYLAAPSGAQIDLPQSGPLSIAILSPVPDTDPKFQGQGFFATAATDPRLLPGMVVPVSIAVGAPVTGVLVPDSAVVWWQGQQWAFVEVGQGEFALRRVVSETAALGGWLVGSGLTEGQRVVVRGAQLLLAEARRVRAGSESR